MENQEALEKAVLASVSVEQERKKLRCQDALAIADRCEVSPGEIKKLCNRLEIKIIACQLGCF